MTRAGHIAAVTSWGAALILLCSCALALDQAIFFGAAALLVLLSPGTLLLQLPLRRKLSFKLTASGTAEKGRPASGSLIAENRSRFLFSGGISADVTVRNLMTGEESEQTVRAGVFPGRTEETAFSYVSPTCGVMQLRVKNVKLFDWLRIFSVRAECETYARTTVLPDTFPVELITQPPDGSAAGGDDLQNMPGTDMTELFGIRDYVPGDSLRAVHWKLSAKTDELLIRIGSLPKENEILLLWDRSDPAADPAVRDALAECMASVGQTLLAGGIRFSLGRMEHGACFVEPAHGEDAFLQALSVLLGAPDRAEGCTPQALCADGRFSSALVFTEAQIASFALEDGKTAVLRCGPDGDITPEGYKTQLQRLIM